MRRIPMSDRCVPVPADPIRELTEASNDWATGKTGSGERLFKAARAVVAAAAAGDVPTTVGAGRSCSNEPAGSVGASVPAEPETPRPPVDVLMPPETLEQRLAADGRLWKLAFEEARKSATIDTPAGSVPAEPETLLAAAVKDVCWKAAPYGETADGDVASYILPKGAIHRLVGAAQGAGISAALRAFGSVAPDEYGEKR
jgi:hypothetical protein